MTNLMLHCGASKIERDALATIATPQPTESWFPIPHTALIERVEQTLEATNMRVVNEAHGLSGDGLRYFGLLEVANCQKTEDYAYVLGLRNSHDKRFPAGLAVGASVFVCDNLSFSGEIKIGRKHTRHLDRDLPRLVSSAVGQLAERWHEQSRRIEAYRSHEIGDKQAHDLILRALQAKAITLTQIPRILTEWRAPRHVEFRVDGKTAWRFFNAVTEAAKGSGLWSLPARTQALHAMLDAEVGLFGSN